MLSLSGLSIGTPRLLDAISFRFLRSFLDGRLKRLDIRIEKPADHALVLQAPLLRFRLEKVDALGAQGDGYFDSVLLENEPVRRREEIGDDPNLHGFIGIANFLFHR